MVNLTRTVWGLTVGGVDNAVGSEAWTSTTGHQNDSKSSPSANTDYTPTTATSIVKVRTNGMPFRVTIGAQVATAVATYSVWPEVTSDQDPTNANAVWTELSPVSHTFALTATVEYESKSYSGYGVTAVRVKKRQTTGTGNLSNENVQFTVSKD